MVNDAVRGDAEGKDSSSAGVALFEGAGSIGSEDSGGLQWIGTEGIGQRTAMLGELMRMARRN